MIFLSYSWDQSKFADKVVKFIESQHFSILQDKKEIKAADSISEFMKKIGTSDYAILLISQAYLKSYNCLNEAFIAFKRQQKNIVPVVFKDADIFNEKEQIKYIKYWHDELKSLDELSKTIPFYKTIEIGKKTRQIEMYSSFLGDFMSYIQDINCIIVDKNDDEDESLDQIFRCLCDRIFLHEIRNNKIPKAPFNCAFSNRGQNGEWGILLSIDIGTSYSFASVVDEQGGIHLVPDADGNLVHRSTIQFVDSGEYYIGSNSQNAIRDIKRKIGIVDNIIVDGNKYSITLLVAMIIKSMVRNAEEYSGAKINNVLMSIPNDFCNLQKSVLLESARIAGVSVTRFIPESSVEAQINPVPVYDNEVYIAYIDLGGGTLDFSFVEIGDDVNEIIYAGGDSRFGSIDFDVELERLLSDKLLKEYGLNDNNLSILAEQIKHQLNCKNEVTVSYSYSHTDGNVRFIPLTVSRRDCEIALNKLIEKFKDSMQLLRREIYSYLKSKPSSPVLDYIYLTGQGTKLYMLRNLIYEIFPESKVVDTFQENAVILGLAYQARKLSVVTGNTTESLLLDCFPGCLVLKGHDTHDRKSVVVLSPTNNFKDIELIESNTTIPTRESKEIEFEIPSESPTIPVFPLVIYEITPSKNRNILLSTQIIPKPENDYRITVEIDFFSIIDISILYKLKGSNNADKWKLLYDDCSMPMKFSF